MAEPSLPRGLPGHACTGSTWLVSVDGKVCHEHRAAFWFCGIRRGALLLHGQRRSLSPVSATATATGRSASTIAGPRRPASSRRRASGKGCPETWRRYQRIGFNSMRLSTSVPTRVHAGNGRRGRLHARARGRLVGKRHLHVPQGELLAAVAGDHPRLPQSSLRGPLLAGQRIVACRVCQPGQSVALAHRRRARGGRHAALCVRGQQRANRRRCRA